MINGPKLLSKIGKVLPFYALIFLKDKIFNSRTPQFQCFPNTLISEFKNVKENQDAKMIQILRNGWKMLKLVHGLFMTKLIFNNSSQGQPSECRT